MSFCSRESVIDNPEAADQMPCHAGLTAVVDERIPLYKANHGSAVIWSCSCSGRGQRQTT